MENEIDRKSITGYVGRGVSRGFHLLSALPPPSWVVGTPSGQYDGKISVGGLCSFIQILNTDLLFHPSSRPLCFISRASLPNDQSVFRPLLSYRSWTFGSGCS